MASTVGAMAGPRRPRGSRAMTQAEMTDQEDFWAGEFGDAYIERNVGEDVLASKTALFGRILSATEGVQSVIEFGCNVGVNLAALRRLLPKAELSGLEINREAARQAGESGFSVLTGSLLGYRSERHYDLALTSGVLIHIAPDRVTDAYDAVYGACGRYLCIAEYYNPTPVEVSYRGHQRRLFKRDWAGELLDRFSDLRLVDYGFVYHRATQFPADDITWFLLERR